MSATLSTSSIKTKDGINWYFEEQGTGPHLVLVPSGEGDCYSFRKIAAILSKTFHVITFDMPGMSRTTGPDSEITNVTGAKLALQVATLCEALSIKEATFYGCSSGGLACLYLAINHSSLVTSIIVHEVPLHVPPHLQNLMTESNASITENCVPFFRTGFNANPAAWDALGLEFHARLAKNYVTWIRGYIPTFGDEVFTREELRKRPIRWTVGAKLEMGYFWDNVKVSAEAGIEVSLLDCKHFPQVSIPDVLADHIKVSALQHIQTV